MYKERIIIKPHYNYADLEEVCVYFELSDIGRSKIEWGDGNTSHYHGKGILANHSYNVNAKNPREPFEIIIECEDCTFKHFDNTPSLLDGIHIEDIDFRESPSLESLDLSSYDNVDFSPLKELKKLKFTSTLTTTLDLSHNTRLEDLDCSGEMQEILLSNCDNLKTLVCGCSYTLRKITLSNASQLSKIIISPYHCVDQKCWEHIQKTIQKNNGTIETVEYI